MPKDVFFDAGLRGWLRSTSVAEAWRVAGWYTADDLYQDGFICYCKCRDKYTLALPAPGDRPDGYAHQNLFTDTPNERQRRHFMNLVQRTFYNHIYTLSRRHPAALEQPLSSLSRGESDEPLTLEELMPAEPEEISALVALLHAPTEIADAVVKLVNDGIDGGKFIRSRLRVSKDGRVTIGKRALRETTDQRMTRVVGDPELVGKTLAYILA
jgi:hypothetical protein